jgi:transcriptional regulator
MNYSNTQTRNAFKYEHDLKRLLAEGLTREQIANSLGIATYCVSLYCDILGLERPKRKKREYIMATHERVSEIVEMRKQGWTLDTIGGKYNVSRERVRQILAKHCPDVAIQNRQVVTRKCLICGAEFSGATKTCSHACGGISKRKDEFTRDVAIKIMGMRKRGMTWPEIAEAISPGCNGASWRTKLQRAKLIIFSTYEASDLFREWGKVETQKPTAPPPDKPESFSRWFKRILTR